MPGSLARTRHRRSPTPSHLSVHSRPVLDRGRRRVSSLTHTMLVTQKGAVKAQRRASKMIRKGMTQMIRGGVRDPASPYLSYHQDDASSTDENFVMVGSSGTTPTAPKFTHLGTEKSSASIHNPSISSQDITHY